MYSKIKENQYSKMEMLTNFQFVQKIANQLIHPKPINYAPTDIWKSITNHQIYDYYSVTIDDVDERQIHLHLIIQNETATCIIYLHGFSSFCMEGKFLVQRLQKQFDDLNVSVCLYDMRGHGRDKGRNITFGLKQSQELYKILVYLKKQRNYQKFILWGRSMGTTTILKMLNDHKTQIESQKIQIQHLVLDSGFSSFQKIAHEIICKKTKMPMIFTKAIFEYFFAAIEKKHKLKLVVELDKLNEITIPAIFLYSENDDLIQAEHTKFMYEKYGGPKNKIETHVGHNDERPQQIMSQVFKKLRDSLKNSQYKILKRRSHSCRRVGLSVTKTSERIKTICSFKDDEQIPEMFNGQFKQIVKKPKFIQPKHKGLQLKLSPINQKDKQQKNKNFFVQSTKPLKNSKTVSTFQNKNKKQITLNGFGNHYTRHQKENLNTFNLKQKENLHRKDKKLRLIYPETPKRDDISPLPSKQLDQEKVKQFKPLQQPSFQYEFGGFSQPTSIFMTKNTKGYQYLKKDKMIEKKQSLCLNSDNIRGSNQSNLKNMEKQAQSTILYNTKKDLEKDLVDRKLIPYATVEIKKNEQQTNDEREMLLKYQSENIHYLKSKVNHVYAKQMNLKLNQKPIPEYKQQKFMQSQLRNRINEELMKGIQKKPKTAMGFYDEYQINEKLDLGGKVNFMQSQELHAPHTKHYRCLSNVNYM